MLDELAGAPLPENFSYEETALVGVFDILGYRGMLEEANDLKEIGARLAKFHRIITECGEEKTRFSYEGRVSCGNPDAILASDTYIIYQLLRKPENVAQFLWNAHRMLFYAFHYEMPIRGAVSTGPLLVSKEERIYIGTSILEAFQWEKRQEWAGASLCPSLAEYIKAEKLEELLFPLVVPYAIPVKEGVPGLEYAINWVADIANWINPEFLHWMFRFNDENKQPSPDVARKIENTRNFLRYTTHLNASTGPYTGPENRRIVAEKHPNGFRYIRFVLDDAEEE
jgi:hypothetical protein